MLGVIQFHKNMLSRTLLQFGRGLGKRHLSSVSLGPSEAGVRVLSLAAPPVNTLTWEVFDEIDAAMVEAESDDACRAIVITAEKPGVFTAGLNLKELHRPDESRLVAYWKKMQRLYMSVYGSSKYCVAAINGTYELGSIVGQGAAACI